MEKRKEPRRDCFSRVDIEGVDANGRSFRMGGMMEDRSKSGFGIRVKSPIIAGSAIKVLHATKTYPGIVRHCGRDRDTFFLGIEIVDPTK